MHELKFVSKCIDSVVKKKYPPERHFTLKYCHVQLRVPLLLWSIAKSSYVILHLAKSQPPNAREKSGMGLLQASPSTAEWPHFILLFFFQTKRYYLFQPQALTISFCQLSCLAEACYGLTEMCQGQLLLQPTLHSLRPLAQPCHSPAIEGIMHKMLSDSGPQPHREIKWRGARVR